MKESVPPKWFVRNRVKLRQLLLVTALGESGNLRRAAAQLAMTQPTATKLLRELEHSRGVKLFERSRRGMAPTLYGESMVRHARALLTGLDAARDEIGAISEGATGRLVIGTMVSTAPVLLPRALAALMADRPGLRISILEATHDMLVAALKRGEVDVMLGRVMGGAEMDELECELLYRDEFRVVCGPGHPLAASRRGLRLSSLARERWILPPPTTPLRQRLDILFMTQAGERPRHALESVSLLTNLTLLQETHMLGVMPADVAQHFARNGLLRVLPVPLRDLFGPVALITPANRPRPPAVAALIAALRDTARTS
jgi:DNA-binding transcriptional LysR family regulator